ncbi:MAG: GNAT family N-acetyltransferase, partial [Clostridiales bacterium]|nr:GNAT family N-acetyltransferase [Clostridiales bacterium]
MLTFRMAQRKDCALILSFIKELAEYENMAECVKASEEKLEYWLFDRVLARVLFAVEDGVEIGFALYFYNYSTFTGSGGIHLEDLFIKEEKRHKGYGTALIKELARMAERENFGRMEWVCFNNNKKGIGFYLSIGAEQMLDITTYRLADDTLF